MSKQAIYAAYLTDWVANNSDVKDPVITHQFGEVPPPPIHKGRKLSISTKYWSCGGSVHLNIDDTVTEVGVDSRGCYVYATWESVADFSAYKCPNSFVEYFEIW